MTKWWAPVVAAAVGICFCPRSTHAADVVDFDGLSLAAESQWNGSDFSGGFTSRGASFNNHYHVDPVWGPYWDGWAYSNRTDTATTGTDGQYTAMPGSGVEGSPNYAVGYWGWVGDPPTIDFPVPSIVQSAWFTNDAYAYWSIKMGDPFVRPFGHTRIGEEWVNTHEPDWFRLTITGKRNGATTGVIDDFLLADYTAENDEDDYALSDWVEVDLTSLGTVDQLVFTMSSSDTDPIWGMNTPAYFAMDNLAATPVPEPSTIAMIVAGLLCCLFWRRRRRT